MDTLELAKLIASDDDAKRRINDFAKAKAQSDAAGSEAAKKVAEAAAATAQLNGHLARHQKEMAEATARHDAAAKESATRIRMANEISQRLADRAAELDAREVSLKKREAAVEAAKGHFEAALRQLQLL